MKNGGNNVFIRRITNASRKGLKTHYKVTDLFLVLKEYSFRRVDDTYAMVMDRGYILFDDGGRPVRMIGAITDITERRLAEQALREREGNWAEAMFRFGNWPGN